MKYKGALIGCGYISRQQLRAWQEIQEAEIVAVCDLDASKAQARAREFAIPAVFTDYQQLLAEEELDFVDIATRPDTHTELVLQAAEKGLHVLCQKPLAESLPEARQMVERCAAAGVTFMVNENWRHQAWYRQAKSVIDEGLLGNPFYARFEDRARASLPEPAFGDQPYFQSMPRLVVFEMGVHFFDTARYLFGEAQRLYARLSRVSPHIAGEDLAVILLSFGDLVCLIDTSWCSLVAPPGGQDGQSFVLEGTTGTLILRRDGRLTLTTESGQQDWEFSPDVYEQSFVDAQRHFLTCLASGEEPETSGKASLHTLELVFAAYRSASGRTEVWMSDVADGS